MREGDFTLSADGGGSKLAAVMFDDAGPVRAAGDGGPGTGSFSGAATKRAAGSHQVGRTMGKGNLSGRTGLSGLWSKTALGSSSCDLWGDLRSKASGVILQIGRKGGRRGR